MKLSELGEFGLIERFKKMFPVRDDAVVEGIGDDTAVIRTAGDKLLLLTVDMLVENVHFTRKSMSCLQIGEKALVASISDIAAMGGIPRFALVSLGLPDDLTVEDVEEIYDGIADLSAKCEVSIIGGDTVSSPSGLVVDVLVVGEVASENLTLRHGAKEGDTLMVTGTLGSSAAYLSKECYYRVVPRWIEAQLISSKFHPSAMIDISDGLISDLAHIAEASGVGMKLLAEKIPISEETRMIAQHKNKDALDFALYGGEDYELLFSIDQDKVRAISEMVKKETGTAVTLIGKVCSGKDVMFVDKDRKEKVLPCRGFDHFKKK